MFLCNVVNRISLFQVFTVDTIQDVHILQKFLFLHEKFTRYIKIKVIDPSKESACFKAEFIGCQVYGNAYIYL